MDEISSRSEDTRLQIEKLIDIDKVRLRNPI